MFRLDGKVAVITGAGGVICSVLAKDLVRYGARVALLDLNLEAAERAASDIAATLTQEAGCANPVAPTGGIADRMPGAIPVAAASGLRSPVPEGSCGEAAAFQADVLDKQSLEAAAEKIVGMFGKVDILINGAGGNHPRATTGPDLSFFDMPPDALKWVFDLNFIGSVLPSQVFGKLMAQRGEGSIVNIASMAAFRPLTKTIAYSSAKAAIVNFTEWLAVHCCKEYSANIRVNAIAPGFLLTAQNRFLMQNEDGSLTERGASVIQNTPMARFGSPDELSGAVIYLCSGAASFVTGAVLPIDGGFNVYSGV